MRRHSQEIESVKIRGTADNGSFLQVNGVNIAADSPLEAFGLEGRLTKRLQQLLALLALRTRLAPSPWTSYQHLEGTAPADEHDTDRAVNLSRWLANLLTPYRNEDRYRTQEQARGYTLPLPKTHLIQYQPAAYHSGSSSGRTRGPFRLVPARNLHINEQGCWATLLGHQVTGSIEAKDSQFESGPDGAWFANNLVASHRSVILDLAQGFVGPLDGVSSDHIYSAARKFDLLANLDMELGLPHAALRDAGHARRLYGRINHLPGEIHTLEVSTHALGQLRRHADAYASASRMVALLDRSRETRAGLVRAGYLGVLGQYAMRAGRLAVAARKLRYARRKNTEAGRGDWASVWATRELELSMRTRDWRASERALLLADDLGSHAILTTPMMVARHKTTARFYAEVGSSHQARCSLQLALAQARENGMGHALQQLEELQFQFKLY